MKKTRRFLLLYLLHGWLLPEVGWAQDYLDSGECLVENNVHCDRWPPALDNSKRAVVLFSRALNQEASCTGALINQDVPQDRLRQYLLTAKHCIDGGNFNIQWRFIFNYQSPDCLASSVPHDNRGNFFIGNTRVGDAFDVRYEHQSRVRLVDEMGLGDMAMIEILDPIPPHFNPYFAGWSVAYGQGTQLPNYAIHHPETDIKKISQTFSTTTQTNYGCHVVTKVVDGFVRLFGIRMRTETICSYTESPFWLTAFWNDGAIEQGFSGSPLFNSNARIIGALSGGAGTCEFPAAVFHGRLSTFWNRSGAVRSALNPDNRLIFGVPGRQINCYPDLNLTGRYFPARDYQPQNRIVIRSANRITAGSLNAANEPQLVVFPGADFVFNANSEITLTPGFEVRAGATVAFNIVPCTAPARLSAQEPDSEPVTESNPAAAGEKPTSALLTASPNPFGATTIGYRLAEAGSVRLWVTNLLGQEVATLVNGHREAGEHTVVFDAGGRPAGVYLYTLQTSSFIESKRLMIVK
ncbi:MAG: T9SS type A sorting domain-containing protein [Ferruginibacter sp.]|nr:T9SS type A sorting domain-containing protein [Cytophagales bacterium]